MATAAHTTPAPAPKTRRSALKIIACAAAAGFVAGRAIIDTDFSPAAWIRELRALGFEVYVPRGVERGYYISRADGFCDRFIALANRFQPTVLADPTFHRRVDALLIAERDA